MYVKNVSYEVLVAVKENTKDEIPFLPQETKEVSDEDGKWFIERYGDKVIVEVMEIVTPEVAKEVESEVKEESPVADTKCPVCGKIARTNAGLKVHMKVHS